jgi:hypothetical protein
MDFVTVDDRNNVHPDPIVFDNGWKFWCHKEITAGMQEAISNGMLEAKLTDDKPSLNMKTGTCVTLSVLLHHCTNETGNKVDITPGFIESMPQSVFNYLKKEVDSRITPLE